MTIWRSCGWFYHQVAIKRENWPNLPKFRNSAIPQFCNPAIVQLCISSIPQAPLSSNFVGCEWFPRLSVREFLNVQIRFTAGWNQISPFIPASCFFFFCQLRFYAILSTLGANRVRCCAASGQSIRPNSSRWGILLDDALLMHCVQINAMEDTGSISVICQLQLSIRIMTNASMDPVKCPSYVAGYPWNEQTYTVDSVYSVRWPYTEQASFNTWMLHY